MKRINVGCGRTPVQGWINYDNSLSIRIANYPFLHKILNMMRIINKEQSDFIEFVRHNEIVWANALRLPLPDSSVEVVYSSHMLEHLDRHEAKQFLMEAYRVLAPNGIIRVAVPDLRKHVDAYLSHGDADLFQERMLLSRSKNKTVISRLSYLIVGDRHHLWMYDGSSVAKLLTSIGFQNCTILVPGATTINSPGELDLKEREDESLYIEGNKF